MSDPSGAAVRVRDGSDVPGGENALVTKAAELAGFANSRDLGGLPTTDGRRTRSGAVLRAAVPAELDGVALLAALRVGFGRVIDLRSEHELTGQPHPLETLDGYRHLPLIDPRAEADREPDAEQSLGEVYRGSVERNTTTIAAILVEIADAPPKPILICCAAGKDRTGMIAAMLLELAGVQRPVIGRDYARTATQLPASIEAELVPGGRATFKAARQSLDCDPDYVLGMLEHLDGEFGSIRHYLDSLGLSEAQVDRLSSLLVQR